MKPFASRFTLRRLLALSVAGGSFTAVATTSTPPLPAHINPDHIYAEKSFMRWFLSSLPQRGMSRVYGYMASCNVPLCLRKPLYGAWAAVFDSNLQEIAFPLRSYNTLSEFFCRPLKPDARPIAKALLVSPVDGVMTVCGEVTRDGHLNQIKDMAYSLQHFLGFSPPKLSSPDRQLYYCVLYLAPGDYHRIHSSTSWRIQRRIHFPGDMYPVNPRLLTLVPSLFALNERIILSGHWADGFYSLSAVAAFNVGSMFLSFDEDVVCNQKAHDKVGINTLNPYGVGKGSFDVSYAGEGIQAEPGQELARFQLGSTVVLVFESSAKDFRFLVEPGQRVRMGQALGTTTAASSC